MVNVVTEQHKSSSKKVGKRQHSWLIKLEISKWLSCLEIAFVKIHYILVASCTNWLFHSENAFIELHCILEAKNQLFHLEIAFIKPYCILASTSKKLTVLFRDCISQNQYILASSSTDWLFHFKDCIRSKTVISLQVEAQTNCFILRLHSSNPIASLPSSSSNWFVRRSEYITRASHLQAGEHVSAGISLNLQAGGWKPAANVLQIVSHEVATASFCRVGGR